jgi:hypothetical protein
MIDTDNVHMLHSVEAPLCMPSARPALDAPGTSQSLIVIDVYALRGHTEEELRALAIRDPAIIAMFSTEGSPNNFPALPVRSDSVFATIRRFDAKRETIPRIQRGTGNDQHEHPPRKFLECAIAELERSRSPQPDKE